MYDFLEKEKLRLSTPRIQMITDFIEYYKKFGETYESPEGKILLGIYNKNKEAVLNNTSVNKKNLVQIIAKPETLMLSYKPIKGNKGVMRKGSVLLKEEVEKLNSEQRILYLKSFTFPDQISLFDFYLAAKLIKQGLYPWRSSNTVYFQKPGMKDKLKLITIPPFMDRVVQKAICLVLESIYEPFFEK